jgi:hypothetical protein
MLSPSRGSRRLKSSATSSRDFIKELPCLVTTMKDFSMRLRFQNGTNGFWFGRIEHAVLVDAVLMLKRSQRTQTLQSWQCVESTTRIRDGSNFPNWARSVRSVRTRERHERSPTSFASTPEALADSQTSIRPKGTKLVEGVMVGPQKASDGRRAFRRPPRPHLATVTSCQGGWGQSLLRVSL